MFRFPDTPIMCLKVSDDINAVFDLNRMIRDFSCAQFMLFQKCFVRQGNFFSCYLHFSRQLWEKLLPS